MRYPRTARSNTKWQNSYNQADFQQLDEINEEILIPMENIEKIINSLVTHKIFSILSITYNFFAMYWTRVPHLSKEHDKYGFVNETEIRIATGITLVLGLFSLFLVLFKAEYTIPLILVSLMVADFVLKVFVSPRWSIFGSIVRIFLRKWDEVWVGAVQKRFAWSIGIFLSSFVIFCLLLLGGFIEPLSQFQATMLSQIFEQTQTNIQNGAIIVAPMNPAIIACLLCIVFMWSESVVGYCVGCHIYSWLVKKWIMKEYKWQNCVNGICEVR